MVNDPVCGMTVEEDNAAAQEEYQGKTWYFCSSSCHSRFLADPPRYAHPEAMTDPVCSMEVSSDSRYHEEYAGKTYYFCSESCLSKFNKEPAQYT
ncbi:MAG TPA: YHS domain-containing protein [Gammaproteobacteria bacterium]|nr:YHS domain-containing protein [Gammaproteobacteria bacterium]